MSITPKPTLALLAAGGLLLAACIIEINDDDSPAASTDDGTPPPTGLPSDSTGPATNGTTTSPTTAAVDSTGTTGGEETDGTTGGPTGDCTENLLGDPGFEAGTPSPAWEESSTIFGTPICDTSCTDEPGAEPYAGEWWVWLGGVADEPELGSVAQAVVIEPEMAYLGFRFQIRSAAGTGDDLFTATLDGDTVFMATDAQMADYAEYTQVYVDVTPWADGGTYTLRFSGSIQGSGLTSFFLDETSLVSCVEPSATDTGQTGSSDSGSSTGTGTGTGPGSSSGT
ncbi:MAG: hypothetical protein KDK70_43265 [Myxococcales bacterium]|nr:hypothetical protein [Myxococcales bacterium]